MEKMLKIPENRKRLNVGRLCLLLGLTLLLFIMVAQQFGDVAGAIVRTHRG